MNIRTGHMGAGLDNIINFLTHQRGFNNSYMLEIGSFRGDSLKKWGTQFSVIYCVDPWLPETTEFIGDGTVEEVEEAFDQVKQDLLKNYGVSIYKKKMTSREFAKQIPDDLNFQFVYIDGDHSKEECLFDILYWGQRTSRNGFIGVHDFNTREGVNEAIAEIWPTFPRDGYVTFFCDTSIVFPSWMIHDFNRKNQEVYKNVTNQNLSTW